MDNSQKTFWQAVAVQCTAILLSAFAAALIAFIQAIVGNMDFSDPMIMNPIETGALGGSIKGTHSGFLALRAIIRK